MKSQQSGFTLIEMIVVIVILGILAATIVPRFANIQIDARLAVLSGMEASVQSASAMYHGVKLALGTAAGVVVPQNRFEGAGADVADDFLYAEGVALGIGAIVQDSGGDFAVNVVGGAPSVIRWELQGAPTPTTCYVQYTEAANATTPPVFAQNALGC